MNTIKSILSRYRPRYIRAIVYMMQASEYRVRDYLHWSYRVRDFSSVEHRKRLLMTPKAKVLYVTAWVAVIAVLLLIALDISSSPAFPHIAATALIVAFPFLLPYLMLIPLIVINLAQIPVEKVVIARAKRALEKHKGLRIAIAGSFGKTTMREILKTVLGEGRRVAAPPGSYNTPLGISTFINGLAGDEEILIFELGEYYPGDVRKLCGFVEPHMGIMTGVNEAHLEKFKTLEKTANTIFELAEWLKEKPVFVNAESKLARERALPAHILYNREGVEDWRVINPVTSLNGTSFTLARKGAKVEIKSRLLGLHNIGPLLAVVDIASRLGLTDEQIRSGVAKTEPFEHRLKPRVDESGVVTIDDSYNGNPDGVRAAIAFLGSVKGQRRFYVTPGLVEMGERKREVHKEIGRQLARAKIEKVVLIKNSVTPYIEEGLLGSGYKGEIIWFDDALMAYAALPQMTVKGDIVLLQNDWPDQYA